MSLRKTGAGFVTILDPGADKPILEATTLQCVHCSRHWIPQPGSGRIRGFCQRCAGPVCGPGCKECIPAEQQLEMIERGLTTKPIVVYVG